MDKAQVIVCYYIYIYIYKIPKRNEMKHFVLEIIQLSYANAIRVSHRVFNFPCLQIEVSLTRGAKLSNVKHR